MRTHELEVSVLSAPLAAIDRGALSQAWYNALHLAQRSSPQCVRVERRSAGAAAEPIVRKRDAAEGAGRVTQRIPAARVRNAGTSRNARTPSDALTAHRMRRPLRPGVELRFSSSAQPVARATFSLGRGAARVHVIMQTNGGTARLVAICRPQMRDVVACALAEARLALAARGIAVRVAMPSGYSQ